VTDEETAAIKDMIAAYRSAIEAQQAQTTQLIQIVKDQTAWLTRIMEESLKES
jgi:hypothetical protein